MATEDSSKRGVTQREEEVEKQTPRQWERKGGGEFKQEDKKNLISKFKLNLSKLLTPFLCSF